MKFPWYILLIFFGLNLTAQSILPGFEINVTQPQPCPSAGVIQVTLTGAVDRDNTWFVQLMTTTGALISQQPLPSIGRPVSFNSLSAGNNNVFQPISTSGFDPYDFNTLIFNRWGEMIFETIDAKVGWDGTYLG